MEFQLQWNNNECPYETPEKLYYSVEATGLSLGMRQCLQMQKIEKLTLYTIYTSVEH